MKRKPQKRKDPIEMLISKVSEKVESEIKFFVKSLDGHMQEFLFPKKPKTNEDIKKENLEAKKNPFTGKDETFTFKAERVSEEEAKFRQAKDITSKVRRST